MLKRQFWAALSINLLLGSLKYVSISTANALYNLAPIFTFFLEAVFYKVKRY
jgi:drug/metabolite transporter (DMT)-like permease